MISLLGTDLAETRDLYIKDFYRKEKFVIIQFSNKLEEQVKAGIVLGIDYHVSA